MADGLKKLTNLNMKFEVKKSLENIRSTLQGSTKLLTSFRIIT
jgi:hypothetical protein